MHARTTLLALTAALTLAACTGAPADPRTAASATAVAQARTATMYRSPSCTCCHEYEAILERAGWSVEIVNVDDTAGWKTDRGIPADAWSCHTTVIDDYLVEGHVPLAAIDRLLDRAPAIDGIALPGMPPGSPGMDGVAAGLFDVLAIQDGTLSTFGAF